MSVSTINWNGVSAIPDTHSCQFTYAVGDELFPSTAGFSALDADTTCVMYAIDAFITARGWSRVANTNAAGGGTAGRYCYKASNLLDPMGASSYKYITIDMATSSQLYIKNHETVTADSAAPVNTSSLSSVSTYSLYISPNTNRLTTYSGKIWCSVSARHILLQSFSNNTYGTNTLDSGPIGVYELTRTHPYDLVSLYPKHCFLASYAGSMGSIGTPFGITRCRSGTVPNYTSIITQYNAGGYTLSGSNGSVYPIMPSYNNAFDGKPVVSHISIRDSWNSQLTGALLGTLINCFILSYGFGSMIGDEVFLPVTADSNFGNEKFLSQNGTITAYWLVGGATTASGSTRLAVPK